MITIAEIQRAACAYFGLTRAELLCERRTRRVAYPRMIAMAIATENTALSLPSIGKHFGGRDHSTVINANYRIGHLCRTDDDFAFDFALVLQMARGEIPTGPRPVEKSEDEPAVEAPKFPKIPLPVITLPKLRETTTPKRMRLALPSEIAPSKALLTGNGREWAATAKPYGGSGKRSLAFQTLSGATE
jgi:hypothetical protein